VSVLSSMKILMIAPEPFFEPRGTPFSEYFRIKALTELGHQIDLATYPIGQDVEMPGLRIHRSMALRPVKTVKVGPSLQKLYLDFFLLFTVLKLLWKNHYDCIHTHEEACFFGGVLSRLWKIPHVYDMHSSLAQQFINFNIVTSPRIQRILQFFERWALKSSDAIIAICPYLGEHVQQSGISNRVFVIENTPEAENFFSGSKCGVQDVDRFTGKSVVLYAGTFEAYQGLDLLMESIPSVIATKPDVLFLLIGGERCSIERYRRLSEKLGAGENVIFMEKIPANQISNYFELAHVLVSPRNSGTNTPLKIYSYLRSGKPIVATNLVTHTQVLNPEIAILTEPDSASFAAGILEALQSPQEHRVERARKVAEEKYSYHEYIKKTSRLYAYVGSLRNPDQYVNNTPSSETVF
jgi:glycosyltransferase involved in cell wall biosynthesis